MPDPAVIINVDDNEPSRYVRSRILVHAGFTVHEAATGAEAVRLIEQKPDLVLLDVHLPDVNGIELCRRIKAAPENASVIVLQISASATTAPHAVSALESGADGYLTEPVDPDVLVATVRSLLRLRKAERELLAANERLQVLNRELRRSNEDLQQFAFAASHDLQEPLRSITSFASLLERAAREKLSAAELQYLTF
ncbi:MAG TPA: response regulator, partial [Bryobacteraceae bacterium]